MPNEQLEESVALCSFRSDQQAPRPGSWLVPPGVAVTLRPAETGVLRVAGGGLWATLDGPHEGPANDRGDLILCPGDSIRVSAGQRLVLEPLRAKVAARISWDPLPAESGRATSRRRFPRALPQRDRTPA